MGKLDNRVALITGGNSGIGRVVAGLFAVEGARVVIAARNAAKGWETVEQIQRQGGTAHFIGCDVRQPDDCQRTAAETLQVFGQMDILFNNAGIVPSGTVPETSLEVWQDVLATNVSGTFYMSRAVLPHMIKRGRGVIINMGSDWSIVGGRDAAAYIASKGAVALLTKAMAIDHARQGIRVNAICPGDHYVERWRDNLKPGQTLADYLHELGEGFPLGRVGDVAELAPSVLFLASDDSSYMTGHLLVVDGGNTAGGTSVKY
ncbi:MAG TPA: glucose 1-dehydrogenase [Phototrophicaceae bacterium]|nr:glucose 1-dehydrogenase [Phototrophicaceae bacterium]